MVYESPFQIFERKGGQCRGREGNTETQMDSFKAGNNIQQSLKTFFIQSLNDVFNISRAVVWSNFGWK